MTTATLDKKTEKANQDATAHKSSTKPAARKQMGWVSAAYFPKDRVRKSDGASFTAHDIAIRYSYKKDGETVDVDLTIPRREALNLSECLRQVVSESYEVSRQRNEEPEEEE